MNGQDEIEHLHARLEYKQGKLNELKEENARLTRELAELTEYTDIVKRTLFALIDQRKS